MIHKVIKKLNELYGYEIDPSYYSKIELWRQWWAGHTQSFHDYHELQMNGGKKKKTRYSLKMAKKTCEDWASVLLNEKTEITVDDKNTQAFLDEVFDSINFWEEGNALVEKAFYSGTGAFVLKVDNLTVNSSGGVVASGDARIRMEYLPAQCIVPLSNQYGKITEAAFVSERMERGKRVAYVEVHTRDEKGVYVIENMYFSVNNGNLVREALPEGVAEVIHTGSTVPLFSMIRPNIVNSYKNSMGLGCAVYAHAIDCLKAVDLAFNNFSKDFELGGKKVFYNRELTKTVGVTEDGKPVYIAPDEMMQQLFVSIGDDVDEDKHLIHEFNPSLRVEDNRNGVQSQLDYLSFKCGLGTRHYKFDGTRATQVTATQYTGEKQELKQNAAKHGIIINRALQDIVRAIMWVGKHIIGAPINPDADITVEFSDGYIISDEEKRAQDMLDVSSGIMQPWEYRMKWYGESEKDAKQAIPQSSVTFGGYDYPPEAR